MLLLFSGIDDAKAQNKLDRFLKSSDTLNINRQNTVIFSEAILASGALIGLNCVISIVGAGIFKVLNIEKTVFRT